MGGKCGDGRSPRRIPPFEAIRRAEHHAPEEILGRPAVHAMIHELGTRATGPLQREIHDYATTVGAAS